MKSLKIKHDQMGVTARNEHYPSASFDAKAIPELKDMKDGQHHHILVKFKKTGSSSNNNHTMVHGDMVAAKSMGPAKSLKDEEAGETVPDDETNE